MYLTSRIVRESKVTVCTRSVRDGTEERANKRLPDLFCLGVAASDEKYWSSDTIKSKSASENDHQKPRASFKVNQLEDRSPTPNAEF